ncbi:NPXTG-anchored protein [Ruania halotolerans]|uniref:NPXTG-anchored protein n=1 Tax=Ruania halotolerans TaxID=2897773 RepID=UPI001E443B92|nr:NPXTG-anchored protein [Ruania halotolerans]UFU06567.1 NPXTG-anchored protein [Ruania halotolerans]
MRNRMLLTVPAIALGALTLTAAPAMADTHESWSGQASLESLNDSGTTGEAMIELNGSEATVSINVSGAAATFMDGPFPHAQHIHIGADGVCPDPSADTDGDGAVSTPEGVPFYGEVSTSLTTEGDTSADSALAIDRFPGGDAYTYERTFELNDDTAAALADGTAVVVIHGVDPANLSEEAAEKMSPLNEELPLAATLPAACGTVNVSQMGAMPEGGADTGSPVQPVDNTGLAVGVAAGALVLAGGGAWAMRRNSTRA